MVDHSRVDDAGYGAGMALQLTRLRDAIATGMPRFGWKVGLNVPAIQARLGVESAGVGWLEGRRVSKNGAVVEVAEGQRFLVEAERAVRVGRSVPAGTSLEDAGVAIDALAPALELVDYSLPTDGLDEIVGHSMFHAGTVLGDPIPANAMRGLAPPHPRVRVDHGAIHDADHALVPADPAASILFCAAFLDRFGERLEPGDWILCGSYTQPLPVSAGQRFDADYGPGIGTLGLRVEARA